MRIVPALFLHGDPAAQVLLRQTATVAGAAHAPLGAKAELHLSFRSSIVPDTKVLVYSCGSVVAIAPSPMWRLAKQPALAEVLGRSGTASRGRADEGTKKKPNSNEATAEIAIPVTMPARPPLTLRKTASALRARNTTTPPSTAKSVRPGFDFNQRRIRARRGAYA